MKRPIPRLCSICGQRGWDVHPVEIVKGVVMDSHEDCAQEHARVMVAADELVNYAETWIGASDG